MQDDLTKPWRASPLVLYGLPISAGLAALLFASKSGAALWSVFAIVSAVVLWIAILQWLNHDPMHSPAQTAWSNEPEPSQPRSPEEAVKMAQKLVALSSAAAQEKRLNRMGVALIVLAVAILWTVFA